jgi:hypothetical protein
LEKGLVIRTAAAPRASQPLASRAPFPRQAQQQNVNRALKRAKRRQHPASSKQKNWGNLAFTITSGKPLHLTTGTSCAHKKRLERFFLFIFPSVTALVAGCRRGSLRRQDRTGQDRTGPANACSEDPACAPVRSAPLSHHAANRGDLFLSALAANLTATGTIAKPRQQQAGGGLIVVG